MEPLNKGSIVSCREVVLIPEVLTPVQVAEGPGRSDEDILLTKV